MAKACPHCGSAIADKYIRCRDCDRKIKAREQMEKLESAQTVARIERKLDRILEWLAK